jgi:hypothetical protein
VSLDQNLEWTRGSSTYHLTQFLGAEF